MSAKTPPWWRRLWPWGGKRFATPAPRHARYSGASSPSQLHAALVEADLEIEALRDELTRCREQRELAITHQLHQQRLTEGYKLACIRGQVDPELLERCVDAITFAGDRGCTHERRAVQMLPNPRLGGQRWRHLVCLDCGRSRLEDGPRRTWRWCDPGGPP